MADKKNSKMTGSAGSEVPESNAKLDGDIITASVAEMTAHSYERGYPDQGGLHMQQKVIAKKV